MMFITLFLTGWSQLSVAKPADVRLLLDVSGSMKQNDPSNLRQSSIELLMQLLPEGSKAGVWVFSTDTTSIMPYGEVNAAWKKRAVRAASKIDSRGLFTNIGDALEKASFEGSDKYNKSIILLTDGMVDIDKDPDINQQEWQRISSDVLNLVKSKGFVVHTVSLSDNADKQLMEALSLNTDGLAQVAKNADQLLKAFLKTFDAAVPTDQVPISGDEFSVDSSVEEFTALIFKKASQTAPTMLVGPDNKSYSARKKDTFISWYEGENYDLITVNRPLEGVWTIKADLDDDSRITIISNLSLGVDTLPNNAYLGHKQTLTSTLNEDGKPITRSAFLKLMRVKATLKSGESLETLTPIWSEDWPLNRAPRAGKFEFQLPPMDQVGFYEIALHLDGRTFQRSFTHRLTIRQAYSAKIEQTDESTQQHTITVLPQTPTIDKEQSTVSLVITDPSGDETTQNMSLTAQQQWQSVVVPTQKGTYQLAINVDETNKSGVKNQVVLDTLMFESTVERVKELTEDVAEEVEPVSESVIPMWLIYTLLGLGNLIFFGGLFFIVRKLLGKKESEADIDDLSGEGVDEQSSELSADTPSAVDQNIESEAQEDEDEEPPMEDLNPTGDMTDNDDIESNDIELSEDIDDISMGEFDETDTAPNETVDGAVEKTELEADKMNTVDEDIEPSMQEEPEDVNSDEVDIDAIMAQQAEGTLDEIPQTQTKTQEENIDDAINDLLNELENDDEDSK